MENKWKEMINYRNIAHQAGSVIVVLSVILVMMLLGQLALDTLHIYAYWLGFAACIFTLVIMCIFFVLMNIAEQEWKDSRIGKES